MDKIYFSEYNKRVGNTLESGLSNYTANSSVTSFDYITKASAVYSSNIEGNTIDLNSFMNYELSKEKFKAGKEVEEIEDLIAAYRFAQSEGLTEQNLLKAHKIFSNTLLIKSKRGAYRAEPVGVFGTSGLVYMAVEAQFVFREMEKLFAQIEQLLNADLSGKEVFYHASLLHLRFAHIHPFRDGNGRAARLIEKWFLASKLGTDFWMLSSEEYYKTHQQTYYQNLNLGVNFYELDYAKCLPFLEMLPKSLS